MAEIRIADHGLHFAPTRFLLHSCARDRIGDVIRAAQSLQESGRMAA
jgi:hypothetical protein